MLALYVVGIPIHGPGAVLFGVGTERPSWVIQHMNNTSSYPAASGRSRPAPDAGNNARQPLPPHVRRTRSPLAGTDTTSKATPTATTGNQAAPETGRIPPGPPGGLPRQRRRPVSNYPSPASPSLPGGGLEGRRRGAGRCGRPGPDGPATGIRHDAVCGVIRPGTGRSGTRGGIQPPEGTYAVHRHRSRAHTGACAGAGRVGGGV